MLTRTYYPVSYRSRAWNPFAELQQIQDEMERLWSRTPSAAVDYPPINIWSNEEEVVVQAELPGYNPDEMDISVVQNTLTVRGERKPEEPKNGEVFHRRERPTGRFVRTVELHFEVDND